MRKLLLTLLVGANCMAMASSLDMSNLYCKKVQLTSATTLADVQANCTLKSQKEKSGMYQVEFTNDATGKTVTCNFPTNQPTAALNSCK
ncbi:MAG: hypothetical protein EKK57_12360 [Proteobacteria bacterium]|nr:MAG: hypothetical protein EKK57_12360 [Pseudomonadota bacterium]